MRVLHLSSGNLYGGVERILTSLASFRALCPSIESIFGLGFEGRQAEELRAAGAPPHLLGEAWLSRPVSVLIARRTLGRLLDESRPDVVVCHNPWPLVVFGPTVKRRRVPLAVWVHGALARRNWLDRWAGRVRPDFVLANSHFSATTAEAIFRGVAKDVVYAPMLFRAPDPLTRSRVRTELGASEESIVVLQASRIESGKGHKSHLAALASVRDDPSWVAWFAGGAQQTREHALMAELRAFALEIGIGDRVHFLGERADVQDLLAAADVFCQPNTAPDAFGLTFVEALAAGIPVVTTRMGGAIEIIDASCGVLVPAEDPAALAGALGRLIGDGACRRALGAAGPARAHLLCDPATRLNDLRKAISRAVSIRLPDRRHGP